MSIRVKKRPRKTKIPIEYAAGPCCLSSMMKNLLLGTATACIAATMVLTSCTYDPAYTSVGGSYSTGYGHGYGYGGSGFSTSLFVSTGDPRWGYDPYNYCYYDYRSRRYYDPYLYGYYPIGYRPPILVGVPHPHGWRRGHGYCPPPRVIRNVTVVNYRDRERAYRQSRHDWARNVHMYDYSRNQQRSRYPDYRRTREAESIRRHDYGPRPTEDRGWLNPRDRREADSRNRGTNGWFSPRQAPQTRERRDARPPSSYQTPVTRREESPFQNPRMDRGNRTDGREFSRPDRRSAAPAIERSAPENRPTWSREARPASPRIPRQSVQSNEAQSRSFERSSELRNRGGLRSNSQSQESPQNTSPQAPPSGERGQGRDRRGLRSLGEG